MSGSHSTNRAQRGFTLVELLTVVAILGILAAIAMQAMAQYRQRAYDARAVHDLGNAVSAEEAYFATHFTYVDVGPILGPAQLDVFGLVVSATVELAMLARDQEFSGTATSRAGSGIVYSYDSAVGALTQQ